MICLACHTCYVASSGVWCSLWRTTPSIPPIASLCAMTSYANRLKPAWTSIALHSIILHGCPQYCLNLKATTMYASYTGTATSRQHRTVASAASKQQGARSVQGVQPQHGNTKQQDLCTPVSGQLSYHTVPQPLQDASNLPHTGNAVASLRQQHADCHHASDQLMPASSSGEQDVSGLPHTGSSGALPRQELKASHQLPERQAQQTQQLCHGEQQQQPLQVAQVSSWVGSLKAGYGSECSSANSAAQALQRQVRHDLPPIGKTIH